MQVQSVKITISSHPHLPHMATPTPHTCLLWQVKNVKITDVALPRELSQLLEQTTTFRTRIAEIAKKHENSIRILQARDQT